MTAQTTQTETTVETVAVVKPRAKYLVAREKRSRYSFGPVWLNMVLGGVISDYDKLAAHGVKLKISASKQELLDLPQAELLTKVQEAIYASSEGALETTDGEAATA